MNKNIFESIKCDLSFICLKTKYFIFKYQEFIEELHWIDGC